MTYSRPQLFSIAKGNFFVEEASGCDNDKIKSSLDNLVSGLIAKGLPFTEEASSFHTTGRKEHRYTAWNLFKYLDAYVQERSKVSLTTKKSIAMAVLDHFKELGYDGAEGTVVASERHRREMIFGKQESDAYYKGQGA